MTIRKYVATLVALLALFYLTSSWAACPAGAGNGYQTRVVVTGFPLMNPEQASWGRLQDMEVRLPQRIAAAINDGGEQLAFDFSHVALTNLGLGGQRYADQFYRAAFRLDQLGLPDTRFLLTGVIENIGAADDSAYTWSQRYLRRVSGLLNPRYHQTRRFALVLELVDRYRGELVWQKRIVRHANWDRKRNEQTGIDNPVFWQSDYGAQINDALLDAVDELQTVLACRPLVARVVGLQDGRLVIPEYAVKQVKAGDQVQLLKRIKTRLSVVPGSSRVVEAGAALRLEGDLIRSVREGDLVQIN